MTLRSEFLKWLQEGTTEPFSDDKIEEFLVAAAERDDPIWDQIEQLLVQLAAHHPIRTDRIRRDLKWLRKQAKKKGVIWRQRS